MAICYSNQFSNLFKYESRDETANVIQRYTEVFADKFIGKYRAEYLSWNLTKNNTYVYIYI